MAERRALVRVGGRTIDLPAGDTLGVTAAGGLLLSNQQLGQIVTNTTVETQFVFQKDVVIPAGLLVPGSIIRVSQMGVYQSGLTQSVQPRIRLGPAATDMASRPVLLTTNGPVSGLLNANTDTPWGADTVSIVMPDGSILSSGKLFYSTSMTAALNALVASATPVTGINLSVDNVLTASAQWTAAMTANQIRATTFTVEIARPFVGVVELPGSVMDFSIAANSGLIAALAA